MPSNYAFQNSQRRLSTATASVAFPYSLDDARRERNRSRFTAANAQIQGQVAGQSFHSATLYPNYNYGTYSAHMHQPIAHQDRDVGPVEQAALTSPFTAPQQLGNFVTQPRGNQPYNFDTSQCIPTYTTHPDGHFSLNGYTNTGYADLGSARVHPTLPLNRPETTFDPSNLSGISTDPQKPYICITCGKSFARKGDRERHSKGHGPPSFSCDFEGCGKGFTRKDKLKDHQKRTHDAR